MKTGFFFYENTNPLIRIAVTSGGTRCRPLSHFEENVAQTFVRGLSCYQVHRRYCHVYIKLFKHGSRGSGDCFQNFFLGVVMVWLLTTHSEHLHLFSFSSRLEKFLREILEIIHP